MRAAPHTLSVFDDDLDRLRADVCEMGGRVEAAVGDAVLALMQGDTRLAALSSSTISRSMRSPPGSSGPRFA